MQKLNGLSSSLKLRPTPLKELELVIDQHKCVLQNLAVGMLNLYFNAEKIVIVCAHCTFEKKDGKIFHCGHIMNNVYYKPKKPQEFQFNFIKEESIKVEGKREWCSYLGIQSKLGQCFNIKTDSYYD